MRMLSRPRQLGVEADPELDERRELSPDDHIAGVGRVDAGDQLHERALAAAVRADDAEALALRDLERDAVQGDIALVCRRA